MKAAVLREFNTAPSVETLTDPALPDDGAIVEIKACGVCRSDHHAWSGVDPDVKLPHVMGHEFAGIVLETGKDCTRFQKGDRVTAPFILGCAACPDCLAGNSTVCAHQEVIGFNVQGAFAERIAINHADHNLVHLPETLDFKTAAAMGCRVTTAYRAVVERGALKKSETLVIHGAGGVGLSALLIAKAVGANVIIIDMNEDALARAKALGADEVLDAHDDQLIAQIHEVTNGGAALSIDAIGNAQSFDNSLRSLRKLGRHVQIGMPVGADSVVKLPLLELVYARQLAIFGTRGIDPSGFAGLLELSARAQIDYSQLIGREIALGDIAAVFSDMSANRQTGIAVVTEFTK